jgi:protein involved in polysaccharide export with SLBB domain
MPRLLPILRAFALPLAMLCAPGMAYASPESAPAPAYADSDYRLGTGDKVRVTVYGEEDLSGEFQIDATGMVRLPLVGQIKAGGLTAHDLEGGITTALANGYLKQPRVSIEVTTYRPFYVVGEVMKPGQYPYSNGMTASSAVALAGGYSGKAVTSVVYIRHQGDNTEQRIPTGDALEIRPGDVVRINSTAFWDVLDVLSPLAGVSTLRYIY